MRCATIPSKSTTASYKLAVGLGMFIALCSLLASGLPAAEYRVAPGDLQAAVSAAKPGDELQLEAGFYSGPLIIDRSLTLTGVAESVVDGGGNGTVITIAAPDVIIRGITVRGSGERLDVEDSGIFVTATGDRVRIEGNRLEGNLIGVYLKGPDDAVVRDNVIIGSQNRQMSSRGNGVHLWNTPGSVVSGNTLQYGRDGIFVMTSQRNVFRANHISGMRYAIHYMYTHDGEVVDNVSEGNNSGFALMYSDRLRVSGNRSVNDAERGLFLNAANYSDFSGNIVTGGPEKCVFIYNSNMNAFTDNYFSGCDIGIHFTGSADDVFSGNAFIGNRTQVKYVGTRYIELSAAGRGNFWSDNPSFDLNSDGIADAPYRPNDMVDQLLWKHPLAKLLINTPAMELLRWSQSEFPALFPGGVVDSTPLMQAPVAPQPIDSES